MNIFYIADFIIIIIIIIIINVVTSTLDVKCIQITTFPW